MSLIPDNPVVPTATVTITQPGNTASPVDVAFTIDDDELLWQAKESGRMNPRRSQPTGTRELKKVLYQLEQAVADDLSVAGEVEGLEQVERLARYHRDLHRLANNFVSFTDFYSRKPAIFQAGTLYLDGIACWTARWPDWPTAAAALRGQPLASDETPPVGRQRLVALAELGARGSALGPLCWSA